jgi:hypothetical protein
MKSLFGIALRKGDGFRRALVAVGRPELDESRARAAGLPPEKWSSLK